MAADFPVDQVIIVITPRMGISCCLQTILRVSANTVIRETNRTGAMLSPCLAPTLWGLGDLHCFLFNLKHTDVVGGDHLNCDSKFWGGSVALENA